MGCANTNVLPMAKFGRMEGHRNADRFLADTYGLLYWIFEAEVVRVEISLGFVVSLRPKGAAFGQAVSTRLDSTVLNTTGLPNFQPSCGFCKWTNGKYRHTIRRFGYTSRRTSFISADIEHVLHCESEVALGVCRVLYIWGRFPTITCAQMGCPRACRFDWLIEVGFDLSK